MPGIHTELTFEEAIEYDLITYRGYQKRENHHFVAASALDEEALFDFIQNSQAVAWDRSAGIHKDQIKPKLLYRLQREIDQRGVLDVVRNGFTDLGVKFNMAFFRPESGLNPETHRLYGQNRLYVMRQVYYGTEHRNSLDMVLLLNGLPLVTIELKNQLTGQSTRNAKKQYIEDRDPRETLFQFNKRALVHFAVDDEEAWFTTKLARKNTRYFPFNQGNGTAAGNPPAEEGKYRTSYLWERIWEKDSLLDLLGRFLHLEVKHYEKNGKKYKKEAMIFPRFHQADVVRKLTAHARDHGPGKNYLVQHSAGSGKSNSIAWLAYRLASLHNAQDERVFDSIIVITDRRVLDSQLQDTIYQFEHKLGVVQKIDEDSTQLAGALSGAVPIIITTLQKFPFVLEKIGKLVKRTYAIIVDEAHSSQGGEATNALKKALSTDEEEIETYEDRINEEMEARGKQSNMSFFAFTATPKPKTLAVFGELHEDGSHKPFHLYSMRQAIEEGFIHDVLKNYTTYKTYFKIRKAVEDDPELSKKKAAKAIGRYLSLHPHNISQKVAIIIEHFRESVAKKIGGKAKAMVVTGSREHAVRYYRAFKAYIEEKDYQDVKPLVAFSGAVLVDAIPYKETELNGFSEKELPEQFESDDYHVLIVAEKYQTGFDQPLLHTMYVDKKLSGVKAVQTLSRLNRTTAGKEDTFVLDFANEADAIKEAFQPYYELSKLDEVTDPNHLYDLKNQLEERRLFTQSEIDAFAKVYFKPKKTLAKTDQAELYRHVRPAVDRFKEMDDEQEQEDFKSTLTAFLRAYTTLAQVMPFQDAELEKFYAFGKYLRKLLPKRDISERLKLDDEVALEYYRLQKISEGNILMEAQAEYGLSGISESGLSRGGAEELEHLSRIINVLNDKLGTDFTDADQLFFDQMEEELFGDETLRKQAQVNTVDNFKHGFEDAFMSILIARMGKNEDLFNRLMEDEQLATLAKDMLMQSVYRRANGME